MAEAWLFLKTDTKLLGFKLSHLIELGEEEEAVDWESLSSPPFDFCVDLPRVYGFRYPHHFVFDSRLYVARGGLMGVLRCYTYLHEGKVYRSYKKRKVHVAGEGEGVDEYPDDIPYCKIYQVDINNKKLVDADDPSIPRLPTPFAPSFLGNISGDADVHCLVYNKSNNPEFEGHWVLSSSSSRQRERQWKRLYPPPSLVMEGFRVYFRRCSVSQDKLFFQADYPDKPCFHSFDPVTATWTHEEHDILHFLDANIVSFCFPSFRTSLPAPSNRRLALALSYLPATMRVNDETGIEAKVTIDALLVNNQTGEVLLTQSLDECLEGIHPKSPFFVDSSSFSLIDLGNGMVCALLHGSTLDHDRAKSLVLCISVFTLAETDIGTESPPEERKFLTVRVHVKRVFTMKDYGCSWLLDPFIFSPKGIASLKHACFKGFARTSHV